MPLLPFDESLLVTTVREYGLQVINLFQASFSDSLEAWGSGLASELTKVANEPTALDVFWSPGVGRCVDAIKEQEESIARQAIAEVLIQAGVAGKPGAWSVKLANPARFLWGSSPLPMCDALTVESDGMLALVSLQTSGGERAVRLRLSGDTQQWISDDCESMPVIGTRSGRLTLLDANTSDQDFLSAFAVSAVPDIKKSGHRGFLEAISILRDVVPTYYTWVERVLRSVVVIESDAGHSLRSGSSPRYSGTVFVSDHPDPLSIAEMLVHESSHFYFYVLNKLGDFADPASDKLYYSPFVLKMRPLDKILMAYHAFSNVYLFYRQYRECTAGNVQGRMRRGLSELRTVEQFLHNNGLTSTGKALFEPLFQELHDAA